jgi:hypothetical protein
MNPNKPTQSEDLHHAIAAWGVHFEANRGEALAFRDELNATGGWPPAEYRAKALGLSVALTPLEHRCEHYGDARYCPQCVGTP